jgi:tetratricopeptide (TPR) repeat protein
MVKTELIEVAAAIADGASIDWGLLGSNTQPLSPDLLLPARILQRIAQVHASIPPVETFASALSISLAGIRLPGDEPAPPDTLTTWGTLAIAEKIGRGSYGDVYRAYDRRLNRTVALKLLRRRDRLESAVIDEGRLMARVHHPHVVTVYGAERIEGRVGLWMHFVDGGTLEEEVQNHGPLAPLEVAKAGIQLAQALGAVHAAGLLHRDVKAQNAMRDADGRVLLTDFGTGRELSEAAGSDGRHELAGTPLYMAPEVLNGAPASVSSDVYGLGVVLFHLATGSFPVSGRSLRDLREEHRRQRRTAVRQARADLPKRLAVVIDRAIDPDPKCRYASASDLETALVETTQSRARPAFLLAAAALVVAAAAGFGLLLRPDDPPLEASRGGFQLRDSVLVARFDNHTGTTMFDGGIEYAMARELSRSELIEVLPAERVIDALRLMKRPVETVVNRTIGREISLRDGRIKVMVTGRIRETRTGFEVVAELVDPADGAVVATVTDAVGTPAAVLPVIARQAQELAQLFAVHRGRIKGAAPVQPVSTSSLEAFQLYNEAVKVFWSGGQAAKAESISRRALVRDPEFAAGWMFQAFLLKQMRGPGARARAAAADKAARRAVALAETSPDWERAFLRGVYHWSNSEFEASLPEFDTAVRLRPDFEPAVRFLTDTYTAFGRVDAAVAARKAVADQRPSEIAANFWAAYHILRLLDSPDEARPYVSRLDELLVPARSGMPAFHLAAQWRRMLPAYEAWKSRDLGRAQAIVDSEAREIQQWSAGTQESQLGWSSDRGRMQVYVAQFYMTLGRLRSAERLLLESGDLFHLSILAEIRGDVAGMRNYWLRLPPDMFIHPLVKAKLVEQARSRLNEHVASPTERQLADIGRAALASAMGRPATAVPLLRDVLAKGAHLSGPYQQGCELLADALVRLDLRAEAVAELERCAGVSPRFMGGFNAAFWMTNLMRLADEYRVAGRVRDAERIEEQLRRLLVFADADHPLVTRLDRRR